MACARRYFERTRSESDSESLREIDGMTTLMGRSSFQLLRFNASKDSCFSDTPCHPSVGDEGSSP